MAKTLRLVFFGTPDFAVPSLQRLLDGPHRVVAVVSQPDRPRGRGRAHSPSPVAALALDAGLPLLRPERVGDPDVASALRAHLPDLGVVVAFGQFLPKRIRELPALGYLVNGHASLLPRHRGAAPIQRAILAGDDVTGVSVMRVEREMDAGPVALRRELSIGPEEDAGALAERVAALTADAIAEVIDGIAADRVRWEDQDKAGATLAPKMAREEARLDFTRGAAELARRVRAMAPSPGATARLGDETLRILAARTEPGAATLPPGGVRRRDDPPLAIATGDGWLVPLRLQRAGKRPLDTEAFLRGTTISDGARLA